MKNELMDALIRYLDCPCRIFEPMYDDIQIMNAYREAQDRGKKEGFIPVMTIADDVLWESLIMGAGENYDAFRFNADHIAAYRRKMLSQTRGGTVLSAGVSIRSRLPYLRSYFPYDLQSL